MASTGLISTLGTRTMPFLAILRHDLRTLRESWLVRIWLVATALVTILLATVELGAVSDGAFDRVALVPVPGLSLVPGGDGAGRQSRLGIAARAAGRRLPEPAHHAARVPAGRLGGAGGGRVGRLLPGGPALGAGRTLANRPAPADHVTLYGIVAALAVVALVLTFQVSLAFLHGHPAPPAAPGHRGAAVLLVPGEHAAAHLQAGVVSRRSA